MVSCQVARRTVVLLAATARASCLFPTRRQDRRWSGARTPPSRGESANAAQCGFTEDRAWIALCFRRTIVIWNLIVSFGDCVSLKVYLFIMTMAMLQRRANVSSVGCNSFARSKKRLVASKTRSLNLQICIFINNNKLQRLC